MAARSVRRGQDTPLAFILLVDDDEAFGEAAAAVLRNAGYDVRVARDFRVALAVIESADPIDLMIADIVMPQSVNGIALSRMARIRRRGLKIIYLSGYEVPGADDEALGRILKKPIGDETLIAEVAQALAAT